MYSEEMWTANKVTNGVSADTYSLGSSVYSDTVYCTPEQFIDSSKHKVSLKRGHHEDLNLHTDFVSDDEVVELGAQSFSTFKNPSSPSSKTSFSKPKMNEMTGFTKTGKFIGHQPNDNELFKHGSKPDSESTEQNKSTHNKNKSWFDTTAMEDYSMEMLRKEDFHSVNPSSIEFSIVDEKVANDTNNNLESDLLDGVERDKVCLIICYIYACYAL